MANDLPLSKENILDAAEQVLRRYGPDKTSVVDVAKALQVSHGTLYRHFASKASLREAVTERWLHRSIAEPLAAIVNQTEGSSADRLYVWLTTLMHSKRGYAVDDSEMFAMYAAVTLDAVDMIAVHVELLVQQISQIVDQGMKTKEFKVGDPGETARAIFIATSRFHHPAHASEWSSEKVKEEFNLVWQLIKNGLA